MSASLWTNDRNEQEPAGALGSRGVATQDTEGRTVQKARKAFGANRRPLQRGTGRLTAGWPDGDLSPVGEIGISPKQNALHMRDNSVSPDPQRHPSGNLMEASRSSECVVPRPSPKAAALTGLGFSWRRVPGLAPLAIDRRPVGAEF
jgi:hypothetical protein